MRVNIAGVEIDNITKDQAVARIDEFIKSNQPHYVVTPYSEIILFAQTDEEYKQVLNAADLSLPDGIGILWAAKYLTTNYSLLTTLLAIVLNPKFIRTVIYEQITGSRLIHDLARLCSEKNYSLALVGGQDNVAVQAANELKKHYPNLKINLALSGRSFNEETVKEIEQSNSDILFLAYSPPKQEKWIAANLAKLNIKVAIGLGGTLDYLAGKRLLAPNFWHYTGLEWLWRLLTQPSRVARIWNAVPVFIWKIYKYKTTHHA